MNRAFAFGFLISNIHALRLVKDSPDQNVEFSKNLAGDINDGSRKLFDIPSIIMQTEHTNQKEKNLRSEWLSLNPSYEYVFLDDKAAVSFLSDTYGIEYSLAFNKLRPGAIKADFLRLAWLYEKGGFYLDVDKHPDSLEEYKVSNVVLSRSMPDQGGDDMCQGHVYNAFMAAHPKSAFIKASLDTALARIKDSWYKDGKKDLLSTCYGIAGPTLLGEQLCKALPEHISPAHIKTMCKWAAGGVAGQGCTAPLKYTMAMQTGETVHIFPEGKDTVTSQRLMRLKSSHYTDECRRDEIYEMSPNILSYNELYR